MTDSRQTKASVADKNNGTGRKRRGRYNPINTQRNFQPARNLSQLSTEQRNEASDDLDLKSPLEIVTIINREDAKVAAAVREVLPQIARAVDLIVDSLNHGGRLIYIGAGTSGRLGVLDAAECPPTFNVSPSTVVGIIAGGPRALYAATEASEDDPKRGEADLRRVRLQSRDTVVAIAASGRTPYAIGALEGARRCGAHTVALVCTANSPLAAIADVAIEVVVGPEVITGSTRMKAGTAQKMVLNMLSTAAMVKTGHVFGNLMVNVHQTNAKLKTRAQSILMQATGVGDDEAKRLLEIADYDLKVAIVMQRAAVPAHVARERLANARQNLRAALAGLEA